MSNLNLFACLLALVVGFAAGCWFYRRTLKRNPQKLEALAQSIKRAGDTAEQRFKGPNQ